MGLINEINKNYAIGTLVFGCRKITIHDLLQFSSKKFCGKILIVIKWLLTGKGLYVTDEGLGELLQKDELCKIILKKYPKLKDLLKTHRLVIDVFGKQKKEKQQPPIGKKQGKPEKKVQVLKNKENLGLEKIKMKPAVVAPIKETIPFVKPKEPIKPLIKEDQKPKNNKAPIVKAQVEEHQKIDQSPKDNLIKPIVMINEDKKGVREEKKIENKVELVIHKEEVHQPKNNKAPIVKAQIKRHQKIDQSPKNNLIKPIEMINEDKKTVREVKKIENKPQVILEKKPDPVIQSEDMPEQPKIENKAELVIHKEEVREEKSEANIGEEEQLEKKNELLEKQLERNESDDPFEKEEIEENKLMLKDINEEKPDQVIQSEDKPEEPKIENKAELVIHKKEVQEERSEDNIGEEEQIEKEKELLEELLEKNESDDPFEKEEIEENKLMPKDINEEKPDPVIQSEDKPEEPKIENKAELVIHKEKVQEERSEDNIGEEEQLEKEIKLLEELLEKNESDDPLENGEIEEDRSMPEEINEEKSDQVIQNENNENEEELGIDNKEIQEDGEADEENAREIEKLKKALEEIRDNDKKIIDNRLKVDQQKLEVEQLNNKKNVKDEYPGRQTNFKRTFPLDFKNFFPVDKNKLFGISFEGEGKGSISHFNMSNYQGNKFKLSIFVYGSEKEMLAYVAKKTNLPIDDPIGVKIHEYVKFEIIDPEKIKEIFKIIKDNNKFEEIDLKILTLLLINFCDLKKEPEIERKEPKLIARVIVTPVGSKINVVKKKLKLITSSFASLARIKLDEKEIFIRAPGEYEVYLNAMGEMTVKQVNCLDLIPKFFGEGLTPEILKQFHERVRIVKPKQLDPKLKEAKAKLDERD